MENSKPASKPVLVTLTSPTAAGKSYLFNYIRDVAKLPCLISTTTRRPRAGEKEGIDYYFIDEDFSRALEKGDQFAELVTYRGIRYGVTKDEFERKLSQGLAFLIVEPSGIEHYVKPAIDAGAIHLKYYIHTDVAIRNERFMKRVEDDIQALMTGTLGLGDTEDIKLRKLQAMVRSHLDRLISACTVEKEWFTQVHWDRILFGTDSAEFNLSIILNDVQNRKMRYLR